MPSEQSRPSFGSAAEGISRRLRSLTPGSQRRTLSSRARRGSVRTLSSNGRSGRAPRVALGPAQTREISPRSCDFESADSEVRCPSALASRTDIDNNSDTSHVADGDGYVAIVGTSAPSDSSLQSGPLRASSFSHVEDTSARGSSVSGLTPDWLSDCASSPGSSARCSRAVAIDDGHRAGSLRAAASPPATPPAVWLAEPASVDVPLLLMDEDEEHVGDISACAAAADAADAAEETERLRRELVEARLECDRHALALKEQSFATAAARLETEEALAEACRLRQEVGFVRLQLQDHHGIMAADWAEALRIQERLREEAEEKLELTSELEQMGQELSDRQEEVAALRSDALRWRFLRDCSEDAELLADASREELESTADAALPALSALLGETRRRDQIVKNQLANEMELRLCAVCRDREKSVLFLPCNHICVCELCRSRLRPYRCPMCQEPVQMHVGRVHF